MVSGTMGRVGRRARLLLILAIILLAAVALAGCGGNGDNNGTGANGDNNPIVTMEMADGGIVKIELYPKLAQNTVANFVWLANQGFYDGLIFHRVIPGFMIQGGDPEGTGMGGPGYSIQGEFKNNGIYNALRHTRGVIAMARNGASRDSAGSQFFIMVADASHLDGDYAAFGRVIEGMEVVDRIVSVERGAQDRPMVDQVIEKMTVDTLGIDYGEPKKMGE